MSKDFCFKCGNTKVLFNGDACTSCPTDYLEQDSVVRCLTVPEQYRGTYFDHNLVSNATGDYYGTFLFNLFKEITNLKLRNKNMFIGSPAQHSKTVFAYAVIQQLFRKNIETFPLFDIIELRKIMSDLDNGKQPTHLTGIEVEPFSLYTCPYLFVKIPADTSYATYDAITLIKERRVRRGNSTIFLHSGSWQFFVDNDKKGHVRNSVGDGSYGTIENKTFWVSTGEKL